MTSELNSCDRVAERLYLGDKNAACDLELLARLKIASILTAELIPLPHKVTSAYPNLAVMHVQIADVPEADLLGSVERCVRFIRRGVETEDGGAVLVHCYSGVSRSAATVAAYLMKTRRLSYEEALSLIQQARPQAHPNAGFADQLRLYRLMGWRLDANNTAFKCYRLKTVQDTIKRTKILPAEVRRFRDNVVTPVSASRSSAEDDPASSSSVDHVAEVVEALRMSCDASPPVRPPSSTSPTDEVNGLSSNGSGVRCHSNNSNGAGGDSESNSSGGDHNHPHSGSAHSSTSSRAAAVMKTNRKLYRCKKCRTILITHVGVLPHTSSTKTLTWTGLMDSSRERQAKAIFGQMNECKQGVFVEPVRWMDQVFLSVSGRLSCQRCRAKLGHFDWNGEVSCACGCTASPGFVVNLARVDVCTMLKDVQDANL